MNTDYEVRILKKNEYHIWDSLVFRSPQGTIFHTSDWLITCASLLLKNAVIYGIFKNATLLAGCSLFTDKKFYFFPFATSTVSMTPYGGFVFAPFDSSKVREKEQNYNNYISAINRAIYPQFYYMSITNSPTITDIRPFIYENWKYLIKYSYFFYLDENIEKRLSKKVRWTIRKANKLDISIKKENNPELYWHLHEKTYAKQKISSPVTKKFLFGMINLIITKKIGEMWIARTKDGEPSAAEIIIWDNYCAHRWGAVTDVNFSDSGSTSLLLYEIFEDLYKRGFKEINLMAGNTPHLTKFISSFNPDLRFYFTVYKNNFY
ncbi:GNAT family N-acetyltransferase [Methanospirillum sp.]